MKHVYVFYAGMLYGNYTYDEWRFEQLNLLPEVYNGCYIYRAKDRPGFYIHEPGWYRGDMTPVLLDHVPKELRLLVLLLS